MTSRYVTWVSIRNGGRPAARVCGDLRDRKVRRKKALDLLAEREGLTRATVVALALRAASLRAAVQIAAAISR
ncbi:MAG TPA: hypothetical protein VIR79_02060, partial [Nitrospira sp.]